jgi:diguanylate cyclase (GGDEF)-like protein
MARGYAAMRQFDAAYRELLRSDEFNRIDRAQVLAEQTTRLQVRYDAVRRDAENAELRLRTQSAQFQIESQALQKRGLWLALIVLALLMTSAAIFGHRALARRRVFADLALRDELTGQPNRRAIAAYAAEQLQQTRRLALPMTVAMIDLDHFKQVNDRLGHSTGDAVLRSFARAVNGGLRGQDRLGRWGGEEWLLVMPGTGLAELPVIFERLRALFAQVEVPGIESPHHLSFSMGAAAVDAEMTGLDSVIEAADRQLYLAKHEGRDTLRCDA